MQQNSQEYGKPRTLPFYSRAINTISICRHALGALCLVVFLHACGAATHAQQCLKLPPQGDPAGLAATPG